MTADGQGSTADGQGPIFSDLDQFVREYLVVVVERRVAHGSGSGIHWCATWWRHPEAISRLASLWRSWETLRVADPDLGMSLWWRDHLDPHLAALTGEYGPFTRCGPDRHYDNEPLPAAPVPPEILVALPGSDG